MHLHIVEFRAKSVKISSTGHHILDDKVIKVLAVESRHPTPPDIDRMAREYQAETGKRMPMAGGEATNISSAQEALRVGGAIDGFISWLEHSRGFRCVASVSGRDVVSIS